MLWVTVTLTPHLVCCVRTFLPTLGCSGELPNAQASISSVALQPASTLSLGAQTPGQSCLTAGSSCGEKAWSLPPATQPVGTPCSACAAVAPGNTIPYGHRTRLWDSSQLAASS